MKKKWDYFRYITWPKFYWTYLGIGFIDDLVSYWHLNVKKRPHYWQDASQEGCPRRWCRYCGKGAKLPDQGGSK